MVWFMGFFWVMGKPSPDRRRWNKHGRTQGVKRSPRFMSSTLESKATIPAAMYIRRRRERLGAVDVEAVFGSSSVPHQWTSTQRRRMEAPCSCWPCPRSTARSRSTALLAGAASLQRSSLARHPRSAACQCSGILAVPSARTRNLAARQGWIALAFC